MEPPVVSPPVPPGGTPGPLPPTGPNPAAASTAFHVKWRARLIATPFIGFIAVGLGWAVVASVVTWNWRWPTEGESTTVAVIGWVLIPLFWVPSVFATLALWRYRVTIYPDRVRYRAVLAEKTLPLERVDSVRVIGGRSMTTVSPPTFDRIEIRGHTAAGRLTGTSINSTFVSSDMGLGALAAWIRARPEIVGADPRTVGFLADHGIAVPAG